MRSPADQLQIVFSTPVSSDLFLDCGLIIWRWSGANAASFFFLRLSFFFFLPTFMKWGLWVQHVCFYCKLFSLSVFVSQTHTHTQLNKHWGESRVMLSAEGQLHKQSKLVIHLCTLTHMRHKSWMSVGTLSSLINGLDQKWSSCLLTVACPLECIITLLQMSCLVTISVFRLTRCRLIVLYRARRDVKYASI